MNKRPLLLCSAAYLAGVLLSLWKQPVPVLFIPVIIIIFSRRRHAMELICGMCFVILFFSLGYRMHLYASDVYDRESRYFHKEREVCLRGQISGKQWKKEKLYITVKHVVLEENPEIELKTKVLLVSEKDSFCYGDVIRAFGAVEVFSPPFNSGEFDETAYYKGQNISGRIGVKSCQYLTGSRGVRAFGFGLCQKLWWFQNRMSAVCRKILPGEEGGILSSICLGDRSRLSSDVRTLFSNAGIAHVLAISGLHISLVGGFVFRRMKKRGVRPALAAVISSILVVLYAVLTGGAISARRSVIMYLVFMGAYICGEVYDLLSGAALAFLLLLMLSPLCIIDSGFILSFSAICGVGIVVSPIHQCFYEVQKLRFEATHRMVKGERFRPSALQSLCASLVSAIGIQIFLLPVMGCVFHQVSFYTVFLNLLVIPLLGLVLAWGLMGAMAGCVFMPMGEIILWPCHALLYFYEMISDKATSLPFATCSIQSPKPSVIIIYYGLLLFGVFLIRHYVRWLKQEQDQKLPWKKKRYFGGFGSLWLEIGSVGIGLCLVLMLLYHPTNTELVMLDVGQGDGLVITGADGCVDLLDGGSSQKSRLGEYTLLPYLKSRGISSVDRWFLTHMDTDHVSGCIELLLRGFSIGEILMPKAVDRSTQNYRIIKALCKRRGIPICYLVTGDVIRQKGLTYTVIYPDETGSYEEDGNNENSLVMLLSLGETGQKPCDIMLTGDLGEAQEEKILSEADYREVFDAVVGEDGVDVLKGGHHGSNGSNGKAWLEALSPKLCIISAGKNNRYHHPGKDAISRMDEQGIAHLCTIDCGQITLGFEDGKPVVNPYLSRGYNLRLR